MLAEKRNDHVEEVIPPADVVSPQVFLVVVVPTVPDDPANPEELQELLEAGAAALTLSHDKPMEDLVAGLVAFPIRSAVK